MSTPKQARAFIVEDECLVLVELGLVLEDLGYKVVGSASDLDRGLALARELSFDVAVLDVNLSGRSSVPIADVLLERGIPFVFSSGYTRALLPGRHADRLLVPKPAGPDVLREALQHALNAP